MPPRVLVVDDRPAFRRMARQFLAAAGFEVVAEAAEAAGALRPAETPSLDLVLLDVRLPDGNGAAIADRVHRIPSPRPQAGVPPRGGPAGENVLRRHGTGPQYLVYDLGDGFAAVAVGFAVWEAEPRSRLGPLLVACCGWDLLSLAGTTALEQIFRTYVRGLTICAVAALRPPSVAVLDYPVAAGERFCAGGVPVPEDLRSMWLSTARTSPTKRIMATS